VIYGSIGTLLAVAVSMVMRMKRKRYSAEAEGLLQETSKNEAYGTLSSRESTADGLRDGTSSVSRL